jgi:hypothetical protein
MKIFFFIIFGEILKEKYLSTADNLSNQLSKNKVLEIPMVLSYEIILVSCCDSNKIRLRIKKMRC